MISQNSDRKGGSYAFYPAQYARFETRLAAEVRLEAYGEDFGQQGWRTIEEQSSFVSNRAKAI
jgi:hypothetical protein